MYQKKCIRQELSKIIYNASITHKCYSIIPHNTQSGFHQRPRLVKEKTKMNQFIIWKSIIYSIAPTSVPVTMLPSCTRVCLHDEIAMQHFTKHSLQDRRWNADKPSAALDPYIPTWLTTSPANHRPANFWIFFLNIGRKLWKVVQSQVELMKTNSKFEAPILWFFKYK